MLDTGKKLELQKLAAHYFNVAASHIRRVEIRNELLTKAMSGVNVSEEAELPGFEKKNIRFGSFENREFVAMMTDIRRSTDIINSENGVVNMFLIFYIYAGIVAKIVDDFDGTATEFLGDGVLCLFDTKETGTQNALGRSMSACWTIFEAREQVLNPFFTSVGLPVINFGIGIDHGMTIATKFGYRGDTDLKAFGKCVYNVSKLCKGNNEYWISENSQKLWPQSDTGQLRFGTPKVVDGKWAYPGYRQVHG